MPDDSYGGEEVLVVPTLLFHELGYFQGFNGSVQPYLNVLLDGKHMQFLPRALAENDPSYKQLIPYCVFRHAGEVFHYCRGSGIGEGRLLGRRSVGVGGHISRADVGSGGNLYDTGMQRELAEEVAIGCGYQSRLLGLINDDQTPVGRVHLGVVHLFDLDEPQVRPLEVSMIDAGFAQPEQLIARRDEFESWSQICLEQLLPRVL